MRIRIDSEGRDVTDLYGLHDESDTILEVGMFENWKVGQTGWVRLRNGKIARAIQFGHDAMPVQLQFMKGDQLTWIWADNSGFGSTTDAIAHLPDCTGFDWETKTQASGVEIIRRERERQVKVEGWSESHDDKHDAGELAKAASCYAWHSGFVPDDWPFELSWWKPCEDRVKELAKAGALIAAEIDRINRKSQLDSCKPPAPHQWKVGDWFVVDEKHEGHGLWVDELDEYLGMPQCVEYIHSDMDLKSNDWSWHPSWCRPCDPPKPEPSPTRFQPSIEYVGIHDAI